MRTRIGWHVRIAALASLSLGTTVPSAHAQQDYYKGKTVRLIVGQAAGGGYDTYGRLLAPFLSQLLPGQPAVTVQNMPGAGSILMANHLYARRRATARSSRSAADRLRRLRYSGPSVRVSTLAGSAGSAA